MSNGQRLLRFTFTAPNDAAYMLEYCQGLHGFYGASSMERLPTEKAITEQIKAFTSIQFKAS